MESRHSAQTEKAAVGEFRQADESGPRRPLQQPRASHEADCAARCARSRRQKQGRDERRQAGDPVIVPGPVAERTHTAPRP